MTTEYEELTEAIEERFPNAKFTISMFETIEEIEEKVLTDEDAILIADFHCYQDWSATSKTKYNVILVQKQEGQSHIRYCDVIDAMIENKISRNHSYMEGVEKYANNCVTGYLPIYALFWGS